MNYSSKEQLEEIKKQRQRVSMPKENFDWLIEQLDYIDLNIDRLIQRAERVEELVEENKRYREVIKKAIDDLENGCLWDALVALKELEGDEE